MDIVKGFEIAASSLYLRGEFLEMWQSYLLLFFTSFGMATLLIALIDCMVGQDNHNNTNDLDSSYIPDNQTDSETSEYYEYSSGSVGDSTTSDSMEDMPPLVADMFNDREESNPNLSDNIIRPEERII